MSMLSIRIDPWEIEVILSKVFMIEVLPAPVRPTIPIFYPALILQLNRFRTLGSPYLYLAFTSINSIYPF